MINTKYKFLLPILSGGMLALGFPMHTYLHLEFLLPIALLPILYHIKNITKFKEYFISVYVMLLVWVVITTWWVSVSTIMWGAASGLSALLMYFAQSAFSFIPFALFYFVKERLSFRVALWTLPFFWAGWEWIYMDLEIAFPWITLGNAFSNTIWLIQYIDITSVYGISFWIVLFNVVIYDVWNEEPITKKMIRKFIFVILVMCGLPLCYAGVKKYQLSQSESKTISVLIIQPNIDPYKKWNESPYEQAGFYIAMIDSVLQKQRVDLVVLPETAIPYYLRHQMYQDVFFLLKEYVGKKNISLLLGFADLEYYKSESQKQITSHFDRGRQQYFDAFNSSMMVGKNIEPQVYHKYKLVPFGERVPYMESIPFLSYFTVSLAGISSWGKGMTLESLKFISRKNDSIRTSGMICYESIFPNLSAAYVRNGAMMHTILTNDGWFLKTYGPYQHASFARLRSIETRKSVVRCANTGYSFFINNFGELYGEIAWWEKNITIGEVKLNDEKTFFVQYPNAFPILSILFGVGIICINFALRKKIKTPSN